jgi:hypothetical protein
VARNSNVGFIEAGCIWNDAVLNALDAEANTCKDGAQLAVILGMKHIVVVTECLEEKRQLAHTDYENHSTDRGA